MSRAVDIKALVSHIIRGDGLDKCRICLGDTSQGLVHLGDTVMMDGENPVTLSELLEIITGVQVVTEELLPSVLCVECSTSAIAAASFRRLVHMADYQWSKSLSLLEQIPKHKYSKQSDLLLNVFIDNDIHVSDICRNPTKSNKFHDYDTSFKKFGRLYECECPFCGKTFAYAQSLYQHLKKSPDLIRACHICAKIMSRNELVVHLNVTHEMITYDCKKCPALFLHRKQYKAHLLKAHAPGAFSCGDCGCTFQSAPAFHAHQSVHKLRYCPNCDTKYRNQACYYQHVKKCCGMDTINASKSKITVTLSNKDNKKVKMGLRGSTNNACICDYCKKTFAGKKFVAAHIQIVHTRDTHRPCSHCGKLFAAAHMTTHMRCHQLNTFKCKQCGVVLKSKLGFNQHMRLHTGEKPYQCKYCGESFSASSRRSEHIRKTHEKNSEIVLKHVCKECPARFKLPYKLKQHVNTVHSEEEKFWYECAVCNKKFTRCQSLIIHSKKHKAVAV